MNKNDIIDYVMHTPHNTNKAVLDSMLNQLTDGGGGGSSDFSTAQVTITLSEVALSNIFYWPLPVIESDKVVVFNYIQNELIETHSVVLYKGTCEALFDLVSVVSGSASYDDENGVVTITGDCSLSYTGLPQS